MLSESSLDLTETGQMFFPPLLLHASAPAIAIKSPTYGLLIRISLTRKSLMSPGTNSVSRPWVPVGYARRMASNSPLFSHLGLAEDFPTESPTLASLGSVN